jgi:outer membrane protein assembly factor BamE (lipoprotein component of BamABCDE complex)
VEGETTQGEVREKFGSPASTYFDGTGGEVWIYTLARYKSDAKNFIPFMALLGTSATGTNTQLQVKFDGADVVERYIFTNSEMEYGTGVFQ